MAKKKKEVDVSSVTSSNDPSGWILDNAFADFVLLNRKEMLYMCMLAYTFFHGNKAFSSFGQGLSIPYKYVSMIMACTGGGIIVPILINLNPVTLANDAYPIAITASFLLHHYFPYLRDYLKKYKIFKVGKIDKCFSSPKKYNQS